MVGCFVISCPNCLSVGTAELHAFDGHQLACILFKVSSISSLGEIKNLGLHIAGISFIKKFEMLLPGRAVHLTYGCSPRLQVGIDTANFCLLAIATDVKTVEVDENLLSYRKITMQSACVDINEDSPRFVLKSNFLIEVAADVIARDVTLDHHRLVDELVSATSDGGLVIALELCNGNHVLFLEQVVAVRRSRDGLYHIRVGITVAHA